MSFNNLDYDTCAYKQFLHESIGPGSYQLNTPYISCKDCFVEDPQIILQRSGASVARDVPMIDIDSELLNITRKSSNCSRDSFIPKFDKDGNINNNINLVDFENCKLPTTENTKLSNPPCTLRGTGINRWEWLCNDPQERVFIPFDYNISNRTLFKDNHRPLIPKPIDQTLVLPNPNGNTQIKVGVTKGPSVPLTSDPNPPTALGNLP